MTGTTGQLDAAFVALLRCPACHDRVRQMTVPGPPGASCLACVACARRYAIVDGIPVLVDAPAAQQAELASREDTAARSTALDEQAIMRRVAQSHYVPAMRAGVRRFAARFGPEDWVLDIGAGWGWHWQGVTRPRIIALDFSLESLRIAKRLLGGQAGRNVHLLCADGVAPPLAAGAVRGVWSVQMLQHLAPPLLDQALQNVAEVLSPTGLAEVHWLNWNAVVWVKSRILRKTAAGRTVMEPYYLSRVSGGQLRGLLARYLPGSMSLIYSEMLFNPDLRLRLQLPFPSVDRALGALPLLAPALARQVGVRVRRAQQPPGP